MNRTGNRRGVIVPGSLAHVILAYVSEHEPVTRQTLLTLSPDHGNETARSTLQRLIKRGHLHRVGQERNPKPRTRSLVLYATDPKLKKEIPKLKPKTRTEIQRDSRTRRRTMVASVFEWRGNVSFT